MLNISRFSISKIIVFLFVAIVLPVVIWYFFFIPELNTQDQKHSISSATYKFIHDLENRYRRGDFEGRWKSNKILCSDIPFGSKGINTNFLRCNPVFLGCVFNREFKHINPIYNIGEFKFKVEKNTMESIKRGGVKFKVEEELTKTSFWVKFENSCRSVNLPENKYLSTFGDEEPWDSYNRKIKIDKYYITNWDITNRYKNNFTYKSLDELKPSIEINTELKKQFCKKEGGQLVSAHVFEAATMFPIGNYINKNIIPRYSWGKKSKKNEIKPTPELCKKMYIKGCSEHVPLNLFQENGVSWIGIYNALGGEIEVFDNEFSKGEVYKLSSKYFSVESKWHDTRVKSKKLINFPRKRGEDIGAAFRCMFID